jgi:NAD(P)H-dependent flavin oxidoreductase YrpB (nitropropane dioxygenase family)
MDNEIFLRYAHSCGWALSRAHARTGDAAILKGYMGQDEHFEDTIAKFSMGYADQNEKDHERLLHAIKHNILP